MIALQSAGIILIAGYRNPSRQISEASLANEQQP